MTKLIQYLIVLLLPFNLFTYEVKADAHFFKIESVDTMKFSRDAANSTSPEKVAMLVKKVADLHPTHIAIGTPYDKQFEPVIEDWVNEARKNGLSVWFRGNFSAWEGWFDTPKLTNFSDHHKMTYAFITSHPDLFQDGDIFTPLPEGENGGPGDPRGSQEKSAAFNKFLVTSYNTCVDAFAKINKKVECGYFSTNGDVAQQVLTKETVQKIGNRVVIDHYVQDPEKLVADIEQLYKQFGAPVVLGEFGAPIPDIQGSMSDQQQETYIRQNLKLLARHTDIIEGINYWTAFGGSTQIFNDQFEPKPAAKAVLDYYNPLQVSGQVKDVFGQPLSDVLIDSGESSTKSDSKGEFTLLVSADTKKLSVKYKKFSFTSFALKLDSNNTEKQLIVLDYETKDLRYFIKQFFNTIFH